MVAAASPLPNSIASEGLLSLKNRRDSLGNILTGDAQSE
jgi:hypothetical protein